MGTKTSMIDDEVSDEEVLGEFVDSKERLEDCRMAVNSTLRNSESCMGVLKSFRQIFRMLIKTLKIITLW